MVGINILCVGKLKERFYREAAAEYAKRLKRYSKLEVTELKDEPAGENLPEKEKNGILDTEGDRILKCMAPGEHVIVLAIDGKTTDSVGFASYIRGLMDSGCSRICFVIGGSLGLSEKVCKRADFSLSFSRMTFPHQLMRIILLEQIYRAFRIINGEPYHK